MKGKYDFNRNQLFSLCTLTLLAPALRLFPDSAAATAGRAAWLTAPAALPFMLGYVYFLYRFLDRRNEGEGLAELSLRCLGNKAGRVILFLMALWLLFYSGFVLRSGSDRMITTAYPYSTPAIFTVVTGLLCTLAALGAARSLVRIAKIVQPFVLGALLLILLFAALSIDWANLLPVVGADAVPVLKGAVSTVDIITVVLYSSAFLAAMVPKKPHALRDYSIWVVKVTLLLTLLVLTIVGNFGAELTHKLTRPFFSLVRNLVFFNSLERIEALVVAMWIFPDFLLVSTLIFGAQHSLRLIFGATHMYSGEKRRYMGRMRWLIPLCGLVSIVTGLLIAPTPVSLEFCSKILVPVINLCFALLLLPGIYITGRLRKAL